MKKVMVLKCGLVLAMSLSQILFPVASISGEETLQRVGSADIVSTAVEDIRAAVGDVETAAKDIDLKFKIAGTDVFAHDIRNFLSPKADARLAEVSQKMSGREDRIVKYEDKKLVIKYKEGLFSESLSSFLLRPNNRSVTSLKFEGFPGGYLEDVFVSVAQTLASQKESVKFDRLKEVSFDSELSISSGIRNKDLKALVRILFQGVSPDGFTLDLKGCKKISHKGIKELVALRNLTNLNLLYCAGITDEALESLSELISLISLNLDGCYKITDIGLKALVNLSGLISLNLSSCRLITDEGLAQLSNLKSLKTLNLYGCGLITDKGVAHLASLENLRMLDLSSCRLVTDEGLAFLAGLANLESVTVYGCDEVAIAESKELASLRGLTSINLYNCDLITDNGLVYLASLKSLKEINLRFTRVTSAGIAALQAAIPSIKIKS